MMKNTRFFTIYTKHTSIFALLLLLLPAVWIVSTAGGSVAAADAHPFQSGYPRTEPATISFAGVTAADLDGNGSLEVLTADSKGRVWAWEEDGTLVSGYPLSTSSYQERIDGPLVVADLDGNGTLEMVAGTRGADSGAVGERGKVFVWDVASRNTLSGWPVEMDWDTQYGNGEAEVYSVAVANVAGDGRLEIIAGTSNNSSGGGDRSLNTRNLYVWDMDGSRVGNFPTGYRTAGIWGFVGAEDVDNDNYAEVFAGRDHVYLHAYDGTGEWMPNYPLRTPVDEDDIDNNDWGTFPYLEFTRSAPIFGDIDGDGVVEIAAAGKGRNSSHQVVIGGLIVIEPNGDRQPGWEIAPTIGAPLSGNFRPKQAAAMADLTGDGKLEIVVPFYDGVMRAYRADGTQLWSYDYAQGRTLFASEPAIGDITGDGVVDIVFGTYSPDAYVDDAYVGVHALSAQGQPLPDFPLALPEESGAKQGVRSAPTLADLDGDCDVELLAGSRKGVLYAWDLSAPYYPDQMPWPTSRHDNRRTGSAAGPALFASSCPLSGAPAPTATSPAPTATPTQTPEPGNTCVADLQPAADVYVRSGAYGDQTFNENELVVKAGGSDYKRRAYLRFDISAAGMTSVSQAQLKLHVNSLQNNVASVPLTAYTAGSDSWHESNLTWNNQPALGAVLDAGPAAAGEWLTLDVTSFVNGELSGDQVASFALWDASNANLMVNLAGRESGAQAPVLALTSQSCGGGPTPVPTQTATSPPPTATPPPTSTPPAGGGTTTLEVRVSAGTDDAEERSSGYVELTSSDLELVDDAPNHNGQTVGIRFQNVSVPPGATIVDASLTFEADEADSGAASFSIHAEAVDNAATFASDTYNISSRSLTANSVTWSNVPNWTGVGETHQAPNLAAVVQEVVGRAGWQSGNALAFIITGQGERTAESYNGASAAAPLLRVEYTTGSAPPPPPPPTPTPPPSEDPVLVAQVNFQSSDSADAAGYLTDIGDAYGSRGNGFTYGWNATNYEGRDRNHGSAQDQRYDTLNHMQKAGDGYWEIEVPNGTYEVHIVAGDPGYWNSTYHVTVEGVTAVNGTPSSGQRWLEGMVVVNVTDGRLTVGNGVNGVNNKLAFVEIYTP